MCAPHAAAGHLLPALHMTGVRAKANLEEPNEQ